MATNDSHREQEEDLYRRIQEGDQQAFAVIHNLYKTKLFYYARRLLNDWQEVEDIVADSFLVLWVSRPQLRSNDHLRNFLFTTVRNKVINVLKAKSRQGRNLENIIITEATYDDALEIELARIEMLQQLRAAVDQLPHEYRRIVELSYEQHRSSVEIARILEINPATIRSQKRRAFEMIRKWIKNKSLLLVFMLCFLSTYFTPIKKNNAIPGTLDHLSCI